MVPLMSESLERRLDVSERISLRLHLLVCAWCARYLKQIKFLRQIIRLRTALTLEADPSPAALTTAARDRIANSLRQNSRDTE